MLSQRKGKVMMKRITILLAVCLCVFMLMGCSTTGYFKERVDKGVFVEGEYSKTGIFIKLPGEPLTAAEIGIGKKVGWGVIWGMPQALEDSTYYEHRSNMRAGAGDVAATVGSETVLFSGKLTEGMIKETFSSWTSWEDLD